MSETIKISNYMATKLITFTPGEEIVHAMKTLIDRGISGAPVVDDKGVLVGILTSKDCLKVTIAASYHQEWGGTVADYMSTEVETLDADMDIVEAAHRFLDSNFRRFPVMRDGRLVGQISRHDVVAAFIKGWSNVT